MKNLGNCAEENRINKKGINLLISAQLIGTFLMAPAIIIGESQDLKEFLNDEKVYEDVRETTARNYVEDYSNGGLLYKLCNHGKYNVSKEYLELK